MSEWKKVKLGDILQIKKGDYITKKDAREGIYPVILGGKEPAYYIDKYNHIGKAIVVSRSGASAGFVSFWNEPIFVTDGFLIEPKEKITYEFLYYALKSKQALLHNAQKGAAIPHVTPFLISDIDFLLPNDDSQHRIATILSRYDSLIENYQNQIKLLEEAAQRLYKEWFVDLHFPGHENTKIVDGVPEGWEKKKIADVCDTIGGGTPSTKVSSYYEGGTISWVTPTDITKNNSLCLLSTEKKITHEGLNHSSAKMLPKEAILMTSRASVGFFGICDFEVCTNQGFISCVPFEKDFQMYLLYNLINRVEEIRIKAGGSTYLEISKSVFRNFDIICPAQSVINIFQGKAHCLLERTRIIAKQIRLLTEARDRLLPKLMSGEIAV